MKIYALHQYFGFIVQQNIIYGKTMLEGPVYYS